MLNEPRPKAEHQQRATAAGQEYLEHCISSVQRYGIKIVGTKVRIQQCGIELDILGENRHRVYLPFEVKGGLEEGQKVGGFRSSDNVKKAIGSATSLFCSQPWIDGYCTPLIVLTPYIARPPSHLFNQFATLPVQILADVIDDRDSKSLKMWADMDAFAVEGYLRDTNLLAFRLFQNKHWGVCCDAQNYFSDLENQPKVNLSTQAPMLA